MFENVLKQLRHGEALADLSLALEETIDCVKRSGKPATVTLTLSLKPAGDDRVFVKDDISTKKPKPAVQDTMFFITPDGALSVRHPRQLSLEDIDR
jgi:hypothetical protein